MSPHLVSVNSRLITINLLGTFFFASILNILTVAPAWSASSTKTSAPNSNSKANARDPKASASSASRASTAGKERTKLDPATQAKLNEAIQLTNWGRVMEAIPLWEELIKVTPDNAEAHAKFGWCLFLAQKKEEARTHVKKAIALNPRSSEAHRFHGFILMSDGKNDEGIMAFRQAALLDPNKRCNCGAYEALVKKRAKKTKPSR